MNIKSTIFLFALFSIYFASCEKQFFEVGEECDNPSLIRFSIELIFQNKVCPEGTV